MEATLRNANPTVKNNSKSDSESGRSGSGRQTSPGTKQILAKLEAQGNHQEISPGDLAELEAQKEETVGKYQNIGILGQGSRIQLPNHYGSASSADSRLNFLLRNRGQGELAPFTDIGTLLRNEETLANQVGEYLAAERLRNQLGYQDSANSERIRSQMLNNEALLNQRLRSQILNNEAMVAQRLGSQGGFNPLLAGQLNQLRFNSGINPVNAQSAMNSLNTQSPMGLRMSPLINSQQLALHNPLHLPGISHTNMPLQGVFNPVRSVGTMGGPLMQQQMSGHFPNIGNIPMMNHF
ncbi:uncharacterized protein LOC136034411 [Artemia franciscana]|uniref:uncharacterized protein LOC136034411 n=1 Tax=Artemia franciscana TaxID=6661 RepID=UPI0032DB3992